jgi:Peptidase family S64
MHWDTKDLSCSSYTKIQHKILGSVVYQCTSVHAHSFILIILINIKNVETFVRADGAFIPFSDDIDISHITTSVKGVGQIGSVKAIDLQSPIGSLIGRQVLKVGRSSGLTSGTVMSYALEYNDEKGICFFTDFLVVGENQQTFDLEGDSGSLIILKGEEGEMPQPIGIVYIFF